VNDIRGHTRPFYAERARHPLAPHFFAASAKGGFPALHFFRSLEPNSTTNCRYPPPKLAVALCPRHPSRSVASDSGNNARWLIMHHLV
jgi:hypothetical protein